MTQLSGRLSRTVPRFAQAIANVAKPPECDGLGIGSFLFQPIQRMAGYLQLSEKLSQLSDLPGEECESHRFAQAHEKLLLASQRCDEEVSTFNKVDLVCKRLRRTASDKHSEALKRMLYFGQKIKFHGEVDLQNEQEPACPGHMWVLNDEVVLAAGKRPAVLRCILPKSALQACRVNALTVQLSHEESEQTWLVSTKTEEESALWFKWL
eukprot:TRINITY_DN7779_c0_g1_i2.p1 TRINITY_DN7779_c0_g1~~TRINITY_DN7779_c0_g1_i2.p1  ORF type:complete len:209 (-),score=48.75 TRINITY_DN7779_c0_g1_i2:106-732(-)